MIVVAALFFGGCTAPLIQRVTYESKGVQLGVETDHTTDDRAAPPVLNDHPVHLSAEEVRTVLGSLEVSGWSGIIIGVFETPRPKTVFSATELMKLAEPFAKAFREAGPRERVFFSIQNPAARYDTDRTAGSMFVRNGILHFMLSDHYGFQQADPGGGEQRDPRDTKGMKLWVMRPAQPASVPEESEPRWSPFEKVHISLNVRDVLAALGSNGSTVTPAPATASSPPAQMIPAAGQTAAPAPSTSPNLQQQVKDLGTANQQLQLQVEQQTSELDKLKDELRQLRDELKASKTRKSPPDRKPSHKLPTE